MSKAIMVHGLDWTIKQLFVYPNYGMKERVPGALTVAAMPFILFYD